MLCLVYIRDFPMKSRFPFLNVKVSKYRTTKLKGNFRQFWGCFEMSALKNQFWLNLSTFFVFEAFEFCHNFSIVSIFHCLIYICAYKFIHFNNHIDPLLLNKDSIKLFFVFEASEFCHNFSIVSIVCTYPSYMLISLSISLRMNSAIIYWPIIFDQSLC